MNFERGNKDVKKSLKIGIKHQALYLVRICKGMSLQEFSISETKSILNGIDTLKRENLKYYRAIFKTEKLISPYISSNLEELRGQWLIFEDGIYKIPE